eukprot:g32939.t1
MLKSSASVAKRNISICSSWRKLQRSFSTQLRDDEAANLVRTTLPSVLTMQVPMAFLDPNGHVNIRHYMGHVNIRHYMGLFDDAEWKMAARIGMDKAMFASGFGAFDLEHHIKYLNEAHLGDTLSVFYRILATNKQAPIKRVHYMLYMLNQRNGKLSATCEGVACGADLIKRKTAEFPVTVADKIRAQLQEHCALPWRCPYQGHVDPR